MLSGLKVKTSDFMRWRFPTQGQRSFFSHVPGLLAVPPRTVPDACSIIKQPSSLLRAAPATLPHLLPHGAAPVATYGTTAPCTERQALLLARASAPRELACAEGRPRRWGTPMMSEMALPCGLRLLLQTCRRLGTAPHSRGLLPLLLLRVALAAAALMAPSPHIVPPSALRLLTVLTRALAP